MTTIIAIKTDIYNTGTNERERERKYIYIYIYTYKIIEEQRSYKRKEVDKKKKNETIAQGVSR